MKLVVFDIDGTLLRGETALPGAVETVRKLLRRGVLVRYLTNNSTKTRQDHASKLSRLGFDAPPEWVYGSALGAAELARGLGRAWVVGERGLVQTLEDAGIKVSFEGAEAVVVGLDREFSYEKMTQAMQLLQEPKVRFIATNRDASYPLEGGALIPGAGSIVSAIATASGREPEVAGKPEPFLVELILREASVLPAEALIVGDRDDTDLEAGRRAGCPVHLVLTGIQTTPISGVPWSPDVTGLV